MRMPTGPRKSDRSLGSALTALQLTLTWLGELEEFVCIKQKIKVRTRTVPESLGDL